MKKVERKYEVLVGIDEPATPEEFGAVGILSADVAWTRQPLHIGLGLAGGSNYQKVVLAQNRVIAFEYVLPVRVYQPAVNIPWVLRKSDPPSIGSCEVIR